MASQILQIAEVETAQKGLNHFKKRRCLIPAERLLRVEEGAWRGIPYAIGMKEDAPFVFAGLWEGWKDPAAEEWSRKYWSLKSSFLTIGATASPWPGKQTIYIGACSFRNLR